MKGIQSSNTISFFLLEIKNTALYWKEGDEWEHFIMVEVIMRNRIEQENLKMSGGWIGEYLSKVQVC